MQHSRCWFPVTQSTCRTSECGISVQTVTVFLMLLARAKIRMQSCKRPRDLNPPIEAKMSHDNLDSIGGFKSHDLLQFCILILARASNLKKQVLSKSLMKWAILSKVDVLTSYQLKQSHSHHLMAGFECWAGILFQLGAAIFIALGARQAPSPWCRVTAVLTGKHSMNIPDTVHLFQVVCAGS